MRKSILALAIILMLAACTSGTQDTVRTANIIAIGFNYQPPQALYSPQNDAKAMAEQLGLLARESGYESRIHLYLDDENGNIVNAVTDQAMTPREMAEEIQAIKAEPQDLNIFYYSGHGDCIDGQSGLILPNGDGYGFWRLESIAGSLLGTGGKSVMLIDACHSGSLTPNSIGSGEIYEQGPDGPYLSGISYARAISDAFHASFTARAYSGIYILAACIPEQYSYDPGTAERPSHSYLTQGLLNAMGYDLGSESAGLSGSGGEITFSGLYSSSREYLSSIENSSGYSMFQLQTSQPTRYPTDLVLFRY